jgi:hypothetical protein
MIEAIPAITIEQKQAVVDTTRFSKFASIPMDTEYMYGYWENGICVGGSGISAEDNNFLYVLETTPSLWYPKSFGVMLKDVLPKCFELRALIDLQNVTCIKAVISGGFKKVYSTEHKVMYVLTKESWRFQKRWPI